VQARAIVVVERTCDLPVATRPDAQQVGDVLPGRDRQERVTASLTRRRVPAALNDLVAHRREVADDLLGAEANVRVEP
jgi:hypothetical protein